MSAPVTTRGKFHLHQRVRVREINKHGRIVKFHPFTDSILVRLESNAEIYFSPAMLVPQEERPS